MTYLDGHGRRLRLHPTQAKRLRVLYLRGLAAEHLDVDFARRMKPR